MAAGPYVLSGQPRQTNLLFIMSDQHQREASGCYGSREVKTPHIDAIRLKSRALGSHLLPGAGLRARARFDHHRPVVRWKSAS